MKPDKTVIALKQSEKVQLTLRSWFGCINEKGIQFISCTMSLEDKIKKFQEIDSIKLSKNLFAFYDEKQQIEEKEISAFINKVSIRGEIVICEWYSDSLFFETDFIPLVKATDNIMIPSFSSKSVSVIAYPIAF
ncbi:MAG: hypothetical protein QNJ51_03070 [Calothrix sp. MO_167.B12]|nr:hypothetical protein [Calothrix sp. MO_167.B12]